MAITTVYSSDMPFNTCLDIVKEHLQTYLDGAVHDTILFPTAVVYLEQKELVERPLEFAHIRVQIPTGEELDKRNGINLPVPGAGSEVRASLNVRQRFNARLSVATSRKTIRRTGDNPEDCIGELISSEFADFIRLIFHRYAATIAAAGLEGFEVGLPVKVSHKTLWLWNMTLSFEIDIEQVRL